MEKKKRVVASKVAYKRYYPTNFQNQNDSEPNSIDRLDVQVGNNYDNNQRQSLILKDEKNNVTNSRGQNTPPVRFTYTGRQKQGQIRHSITIATLTEWWHSWLFRDLGLQQKGDTDVGSYAKKRERIP